tara:strand:+ start:32 stop:946 length:915 start_codon:yes stop_codon:yes gene_type:complete
MTKKTIIKETTHKEYTYKLKQVLEKIDKNTFLEDLEWDRGGRRVVMQAMKEIEEGTKCDLKDRCQSLLSQVFDFAIREGWLQRFQNPAMKLKGEKSTHKTEHHPTIKWEEVPELLQKINLNKCNSQHQVVLSVKLMLMTFLRAGALTRLEWEWIDDESKMLIIPAKTSGLKRKKGVNDDIDHHVPLTKEMNKVLANAKEFSGGKKYIFQPLMQSRYPHLDPSAPNNFLRNIGYKDIFRAHGWRRTALTAGIDIFKIDKEVIRKQMGHLPEGKVEKAYNESLLLDERRLFLEKWCASFVEQGLKI